MKISLRRRHKSMRNPSRSGSVLVLVIIIGALLTLITISSLRLTVFANRMTGRSYRYHQALAIAEAGLERAIHEVNEGNVSGGSWSSTETVTTDTGETVGEFIVTITGLGSGNPMLESTGYIPSVNDATVNRTVRINAEVDLAPSFFDWALYSYDDLKFGTDYFIDSYDSTLGPYPGIGNGNSNANLGAVGNGELGGNIDVYGSVELGGVITSNSPSTLGNNGEGDPNELLENSMPTNPPIFPDAELTAAQASNNNAAITIVESDGSTSAFAGGTVLTEGSNVAVVMPPGDYYFTEIDLGSNVEIRVEPAGEVRVFLRAPTSGDYAIKIGSFLQLNANTANPSNYTFFIQQGQVEIQSNATIFAGLFAPYSDITIQSDYDWYGAIVGAFIEMQSSENFHYDESLGSEADVSGGVLVNSWVEVTPPAI